MNTTELRQEFINFLD